MLSHVSFYIVLRAAFTRLSLAIVAALLAVWSAPAHAVFIDPASISGNVAWFDGADATTITADIDGINQWSDKSPQLNHAALAAGGTQHPSYELGVVNGNNIVRFDGDDYLDLTTTLSMQSVFAVVKQTSGTALQRIFDGGPGAVGAIDGLTTLSGNYAIRFNSSTDTTIGPVTSSFRIIGGAADGSSSYTVLDGALTDQGANSFNTNLNYALGRPYAYTGGQYLIGDLAELIVYDRILTDGSESEYDNELNDILFYLQEKWGIDAGLSATPVFVPEPSTLLLLGLGLPFGLRRKRRRHETVA